MNQRGLDLSALVWGTLFTLTGVAFLAQEWGVWRVRPGVLLPLLLIVLGVLLLTGALLRQQPQVETTTASLPLDGAGSARLRLNYGAGTLRVTGGAGPGLLYEGTFTGGVRQEAHPRGDGVDVTVRHATGAARSVGWSRPLDWDMRLASGLPLDLEVHTGASRVSLDLTALLVRSLRIETGASDVDVVLPARGRCLVEIEAGAADVSVRVPEGVAASVRTSSALASVNIDPARFPRVNGVHRSPDFDQATDRAQIELEGGLASFSVR